MTRLVPCGSFFRNKLLRCSGASGWSSTNSEFGMKNPAKRPPGEVSSNDYYDRAQRLS